MNTGRNGFTLVELVVVVALVVTLVAVATANFNDYSRKSSIECQMKMIFADLMTARAHSLYRKQRHTAKFTPTVFSIYSSEVTTCHPLLKRDLKFPLVNDSLEIAFTEQGVAETNASICVDGTRNPAAYDSLVIHTARIQMGKKKAGTACQSSYITTR